MTQAQLDAIVADAEINGLESTLELVKEAFSSKRVATTSMTIASAMTLRISNWGDVETFLQVGVPSSSLYLIRKQIRDKINSRSDNKLDVLFLSLYAALESHQGPITE